MERGEGERLHDERRKRFWLILAALAGLGAGGGFVSGFVAGYSDARGLTADPLYGIIGSIGVVLIAVLAAFFSWRFFVSVDEVEVADNLWASLIGFYAYAILFPAWWALHRLERVPEPDHWAIYATAMIVTIAAYAARKWRSRA